MTPQEAIEILEKKAKSGGRYPIIRPEQFQEIAEVVKGLMENQAPIGEQEHSEIMRAIGH